MFSKPSSNEGKTGRHAIRGKTDADTQRQTERETQTDAETKTETERGRRAAKLTDKPQVLHRQTGGS